MLSHKKVTAIFRTPKATIDFCYGEVDVDIIFVFFRQKNIP